VLQYNEVDRQFGRFVEPAFALFANLPTNSFAEHVAAAKEKVWVDAPDGPRVPIVYQRRRPQADESTRRIQVPGVGTYSLRTADPNFPLGEMPLTASVEFSAPAIVVTLWKAAFLTLFRILGYRFVYSYPGQFMRHPLAEFVAGDATRQDAMRIFDPVRDSFNIFFSPDVSLPVWDTLRDGKVLAHHSGHAFVAQSVVFAVNGSMLTITVPAPPTSDEDWPEVEAAYLRFLSEPSEFRTCFGTVSRKAGYILDGGSGFSMGRPTPGDLEQANLPPHLKGPFDITIRRCGTDGR
jgi:hypothetical protein